MLRTLVEAGAAITARSASRGSCMPQEFKPYVEAERFDKRLAKLEKRFPITKDNIHSWTLFHRTVQSTLIIIEKQLEKTAKDAAS